MYHRQQTCNYTCSVNNSVFYMCVSEHTLGLN